MKKIAIIALLFSTVILLGAGDLATAQTAASNAAPNAVLVPKAPDFLELVETSHNFGQIPQGRPAVYMFQIINHGPTPLKLDNVQASCGCTTPEWSREPIAPGATAAIKVGYNAYAAGPFTKTVTIVYNSNRTKTLTITGEVYKSPAGSAPDNASLSLLKQSNR